ncbi:O-methyltransferase [Ornithinibacillus halotolerans]|uniref:tRNA 5-hydroxyuridine methyltransferase n=1 Tax=Ornithinibacillus halotolerans TaxID=1274357 RepID=A0A916W629_9BACI|nr:O-methyltransferase [Ornithinibacillus halotolerans]GGA69066.1 SAM-dependent methyltransferase [Ornithinibacillus halotolerans]
MNELLNQYLNKHLPLSSNWVIELEKQAKIDRIPIMDPIGMNFLMQLIRLNKPKKILEVGAAIGYSALRMHEAYPESHITTIERDDVRYKQAVENISKQNKASNITIIHGDALEELEELANKKLTYNCIFIDAAKGQYKKFFELSIPLLEDNGFVVTDNVLFRGYVAEPEFDHPRYKKMVEKIRVFNEWLVNHPNFVTTILPIGDGVAISYKK